MFWIADFVMRSLVTYMWGWGMDRADLPRTEGMDWLATRAADPEEPRFHVQQDLDSYGFRSGAPPAKEGEAQDDAAPKHGAADVADTTRGHRSCPAKVIEFVADEKGF